MFKGLRMNYLKEKLDTINKLEIFLAEKFSNDIQNGMHPNDAMAASIKASTVEAYRRARDAGIKNPEMIDEFMELYNIATNSLQSLLFSVSASKEATKNGDYMALINASLTLSGCEPLKYNHKKDNSNQNDVHNVNINIQDSVIQRSNFLDKAEKKRKNK